MVLKFTENTGSDNPLNNVDLDDYINPTLVDIDNDNDFDVIAGSLDTFNGKFGTYEGDAVYYYENTGNINNASFASEDTTTYNSLNLAGSTPTFVDIDNDGDFDAFLGASDGTVTYFKNTGSKTSATFTEQDSDFFNASDFDSLFDITNSATAFVDIDNDGDLDAYIGKGEGIVRGIENEGTANNYNFSSKGLPSIDVDGGSNPKPTFTDVDGDGDFDAFVGFGDGTVSYYENTGDTSSAAFSKRTGTDNPFDGIDFGDDSAPVFADIDNDGDDDAFVGSSSGTIRYFENITTVTMTAVTGSTAEADEGTQANHAQFKLGISKTNHGGLDVDFSVNSNVQRGVSTASQFGDDYRLYYLDSSNNQQYINGDSFYIEDGIDELTVYVEPIDDYIYESDETITINLETSEDYDLEGNDSVSITITDNEPTVGISDYSTTIYETASDFGDGVSLDGVDDYVDLGSTSALQITGNQTIEMWIKPAHFDERQNPYAKAYGGEGTITLEENGSLSYYYGTAGKNSQSYQRIRTEANVLEIDKWSHIALVRDFDSNKISWYIDGEEATLIDSSTPNYDAAVAGTNSAYIGRGYRDNFAGEIDEFRMWSTARTTDEIKDNLYQSLEGTEANLAAYYTFDEDSVDDNIIADLTGNLNDSTLTNGDGDNFDSSLSFIGHIDLELDNEVANEPGITVNYQIDSDSTATQGVDFYSSEVDVSTTDGVDPVNSVFIPQGEDSGRIYLAALPDAVAEGDEDINLKLVADFNDAISLDGSDDYIAVNSDSSLNLSGGKFTIEAWIHPQIDSSYTGYNGFFGYQPSGGATQRYCWVVDSQSK